MLTPSLPPFTQSKAWRLLAGRYAILSTIFLSACMLFGAPKPAFAWLKICNRAYEKVTVAVATYQRYGGNTDRRPGESKLAVVIPAGWRSRGWWNISPGDCAVVDGEKIRNRYAYIHLLGMLDFLDTLRSRGIYVNHSSTFCTDQARFGFMKNDGDSSRRYCTSNKYQSFARIDTKNYVNYTYTILPEAVSVFKDINKNLDQVLALPEGINRTNLLQAWVNAANRMANILDLAQ